MKKFKILIVFLCFVASIDAQNVIMYRRDSLNGAGADLYPTLTNLNTKVDKALQNQTFTGTVDLSKDVNYSNYTMSGALVINIDITKDSCAVAKGVIIGNGTNTPTTRLTVWDGAFDPTNLAQNAFEIRRWSNGVVYIAWKKLN